MSRSRQEFSKRGDLMAETRTKRRPVDPLEREILAAIEKAGARGLTELAADRLFKRRRGLAKRVEIFAKLRGRGLITAERSPGGGVLWKKRETQAPQDKEPDDPKLLRAYFCPTWPSLSVGTNIVFLDGFFATANPALQKQIESCSGYNVQITCVSGEEALAAVEAAERAAKARGDRGSNIIGIHHR
jgi:hypothetical protein